MLTVQDLHAKADRFADNLRSRHECGKLGPRNGAMLHVTLAEADGSNPMGPIAIHLHKDPGNAFLGDVDAKYANDRHLAEMVERTHAAFKAIAERPVNALKLNGQNDALDLNELPEMGVASVELITDVRLAYKVVPR